MNIFDLPAPIQLGKMWRQQSTTECSTERKISSVPVLKHDVQKAVSALQLHKKKCFQNIMIKIGISR